VSRKFSARLGFVIAVSALLLGASLAAHAQTETVLYNFAGIPDGANSWSSLTADGKGNFYGTTNIGGMACAETQSGCGTVFELSPNGVGGLEETVLYRFCSEANCTDGANPLTSDLIFDGAGNLYGTTWNGGTNGYGAVFELNHTGAGWKETVLYSFGSYPGDGIGPFSGVIMDSAGNLYGTTQIDMNGGGGGTVFELSPSGGGWKEQVIYTAQAGEGIDAGLTMDAAGNIFGAGYYSVFELSPNGNGGWNSRLIHSFRGYPHDGWFAYGTPAFDQEGNLYGTTLEGGKDDNGTVYKLSPVKKRWEERVLHSFKGTAHDGYEPFGGVTLDSAGNIYGTTSGITSTNYGTIFELVAPVGKGAYKEKIIRAFNNTDGGEPVGGLILDGAGNIYGTTILGGSNGYGVVFEVTP